MLAVALIFIVFPTATWCSDVALQNVLDTASYLSGRAGISLGLATPAGTTSLAAGHKNRELLVDLQPDDRVGLGSGTKMFTAAAALHAVDTGRVGLDDLALPHVDPLVRRVANKSLIQYLGPRMHNVTVRHLLHMTSGISDFDSATTRYSQLKHPSLDPDIDDYLGEFLEAAQTERKHNHEDVFSCDPGACGEYSSTNYFILGLMLAQLSGAKHWMEYDQSAFLPAGVRQKMPQTIFPLRGACSKFTHVHGYSRALGFEETPLRRGFMLDNNAMPCNSGFTVANALSTGKEVAIYLKALLGNNEILQPRTIAEMTKLRWLETGLGTTVSVGKFYGMGIRDVSATLNMNPVTLLVNPEIFVSGLLLGHDGWSNGWNSFSAYAPRHDFAFSFLTNFNMAAVFFPFLARKTYDISSSLTPLVDKPLQGTYELKEYFLKQQRFRTVARIMKSA